MGISSETFYISRLYLWLTADHRLNHQSRLKLLVNVPHNFRCQAFSNISNNASRFYHVRSLPLNLCRINDRQSFAGRNHSLSSLTSLGTTRSTSARTSRYRESNKLIDHASYVLIVYYLVRVTKLTGWSAAFVAEDPSDEDEESGSEDLDTIPAKATQAAKLAKKVKQPEPEAESDEEVQDEEDDAAEDDAPAENGEEGDSSEGEEV